MAQRALRSLIRRTIVRSIGCLPDSVQMAVKGGLALKRPLDYERRLIQLHVDTPEEYFVRCHSCSKEPETIGWIHDHIVPGDVVYDVGANVGAYSLVIAAHTDNKARVYAFEPGAANFSKLCQNVFCNGFQESIIPLPVALSGRTGLDWFRYSRVWAGAASHCLADEELPPDSTKDSSFSQQVICFRLDDFIAGFGIDPPRHIKIDVDGSEYRVLAGASKTLARESLRTILLEIENDIAIRDQIKARLSEHGFRIAACHPHRAVSNFIFVRN